jgi:hypothetical protein
MFDLSPEFRHQLAADRRASLQRSAEHRPAGSLRRAAGSGLVRLGLRLGYDGSVPPFARSVLTRAPQWGASPRSRPHVRARDELLAAYPDGIPGSARLDRVLPERLSQLRDVALEDVRRGHGRVAGP